MTFWYKTSEHKPSDSGQYLVFQEKTGYCLIADCSHYKDGTFYFSEAENNFEEIIGVTHFAQIPPIPLP